MNTLYLHQRYDEDSQILWREAIGRGWAVERADRLTRRVDGQRAAIYGGYMWTPMMAKQLGIELISPPEGWLVSAPYDLTRRVTKRCRLGEADMAYPFFAKSVSGKTIPSRVYYSRDDLPPGSEDEDVLVQPVVGWEYEYRAFVADGELKALSLYADHGQLRVEPWSMDGLNHCREAAAYVTSIISRMPVLRSLVVDVGEIGGAEYFDRWAVVELNPSWCSGVYACDPAGVFDAVVAASRS